MIRVEMVTVCVGYSDFLSVSLAENLPHIDDAVVVTCPNDRETQEVCKRHDVRFVMSEEYKRDGEFNKGRMIRRGLDAIGGQDWILHLDSDCILPFQFRRYLDWAHIDPQNIYGADRQNITGWENWQNLKRAVGGWSNHSHECGHWFHPKFPMGSRWVSSVHGYAGIGAFQLFHGSALTQRGYHVRNYPITHGDCARTDMQFSLQFDRRNRVLLPEVIILHLESESAPLGANWKGRTTKRFGPEFKHEPPKQHPPSQPQHRPEPPRHHHPEPPRHRREDS
jgi:hypothetical protein